MKFIDIFKYNLRALSHVKVRTWLTIIGVVISIMAILLLSGLGKGLNKRVDREFDKFGSNTIMVIPMNLQKKSMMSFGFSTSGKLYEKDVGYLKKFPEIEYISRVIYGSLPITYKSQEMKFLVVGVEPDLYLQTASLLMLKKGRFLSKNDKKVAVLGHTIAEDSFDKSIDVGNYILINGERYRVIGVLEKTGDAMSSIDSRIYIPIHDARKLFKSRLSNNEIDAIRLTVKKDYDVKEVAEKIKEELRLKHGVKEGDEDFGIITLDSMLNQINTITSLINSFILAIAGISLVVGGIGVGNTMYMSVVERTKEIGILRSIGATRKDILLIFLLESIILTTVGGLIGIVLSSIILYLLNPFIPFSLSLFDVFFALIFSMIIGVITGYLPARKAQNISPLEALRYE